MKRIVICAILLGICVSISVFAHIRVERLNTEINSSIDALILALNDADVDTITMQAEKLNEYWEEEEHILVHVIRHSYLDTITISMARLPALAAYGDNSEVLAELRSIRRQMEHVLESEKLSLGNLL